MENEVLKNIRYVIKGAWKYNKKIFLYFVIYIIFLTISSLVNAMLPKYIIDEILSSQRKEVFISLLACFSVALVISNFITIFLKSYVKAIITDIRFKFLSEYYKVCMTTDYENIEKPDFLNDSEVAFSCLNSDDKGITKILDILFSTGAFIFVLIVYALIVSRLSIAILLVMVLNVIIVNFFLYLADKYKYKRKNVVADANRNLYYIFNLMSDFSFGKDIRLYNLAKWLSGKYTAALKKSIELTGQISKKYLNIKIIDSCLMLTQEFIVYVYLIYLVINKNLSIGDFTMYVTCVTAFSYYMKEIVKNAVTLKSEGFYIADLRKLLGSADFNHNVESVKIPGELFEIEFKNVSFKYSGSERYVFKDLNIRLNPGDKIAIVGQNGAGKTTFVKLLMGLYKPTEGNICLNGVDIAMFSKKEYFKLFSVLFQKTIIFPFTIAENIAVTSKEYFDLKNINVCIEKVELKDKVSELKNGIDTSLQKIFDESGILLSGGQNQSIALARALYKDGEIVILDEPTASLDPISEKNVYENFNEITKGKSAVFISHRLASTQFCDIIILFEDGKIIEKGTHKELLLAGKKYSEMFKLQAQYYTEEGVNSYGF